MSWIGRYSGAMEDQCGETIKAAPGRGDPARPGSWYWSLPKEQKEDFSRADFVRPQLMQLGIGHELDYIQLNDADKRLRIAPAAAIEGLRLAV